MAAEITDRGVIGKDDRWLMTDNASQIPDEMTVETTGRLLRYELSARKLESLLMGGYTFQTRRGYL